MIGMLCLQDLVRDKLGLDEIFAKPVMEVFTPRAKIRHSVEAGLKALGIMEFVDEIMKVTHI